MALRELLFCFFEVFFFLFIVQVILNDWFRYLDAQKMDANHRSLLKGCTHGSLNCTCTL